MDFLNYFFLSANVLSGSVDVSELMSECLAKTITFTITSEEL